MSHHVPRLRREVAGRSSALVVLALSVATASVALEEGAEAPAFRLPPLAGDGIVRSDSLFAARPHTLVIVWNTGCPDCVADLVETGRLWPGSDPNAQLVGICTDVDRVGDARRLARGARLAFPNLWDADRSVERSWGTVGLSFSAFLVDSAAIVRFVHPDHPEDVRALLEAVAECIATSGEADRGRP